MQLYIDIAGGRRLKLESVERGFVVLLMAPDNRELMRIKADGLCITERCFEEPGFENDELGAVDVDLSFIWGEVIPPESVGAVRSFIDAANSERLSGNHADQRSAPGLLRQVG